MAETSGQRNSLHISQIKTIYQLLNKIRNLRILESPENKTPMMARIVKQQITQFPIKTEQKIRVLLKVQQQGFFDLRTSA